MERDKNYDVANPFRNSGSGPQFENDDLLKNTYTSSQYAFELYYFEQNKIIEFQHIHRDFTVAPESYYDLLEEIFRAILAKDEHVLDKIVSGVELIGTIHYGNWRAVTMRTMDYTGVLISRLYRYHLLETDFMVYEISEMVGYNNTRTFTDAFKQTYEISPADFRRKYRK